MELINLLHTIIEISLSFIFSSTFIIILFIFIIVYHILLFLLRDRRYLAILKDYKDLKEVFLEDLNSTPLVNFVIPAWKEGKNFEKCLKSIEKFSYPKLKVIVNAGGNELTLKIANSFKNNKNFVILKQKAGGGKIKAINDGLKYVNEGLVYLIDADSFINEQMFLKMISKIINDKRDIVVTGVRPLKEQQHKDLVKYITINRYTHFRSKFQQFRKTITPHTCLNFEVLEKVGLFEEKRLIADGWVGLKLTQSGYKILELADYKWFVYTYYPENIKYYITQNIRWIENTIFNKLKGGNRIKVLRTFIVASISIYLFISLFLFFTSPWCFYVGLIGFMSLYLKKLRKILFFNTVQDEYLEKFGPLFYLKLIFFIFIDLLINIIIMIELILFRDKKYKKRKNID